ncbi:MAG: malate synthase A [Acidobacteria bacterium]|nr:malate synthase A [Acidobacteriota bacterium]MCB9397167.1 malate synthase A [Acidobacteriota bacterium]
MTTSTLNETALNTELLLTDKVQQLIEKAHRAFEATRQNLLIRRAQRQAKWDAGELPKVPDHPEAQHGAWRVRPLPLDLQTRRVEITGPINNPKMVINMLSRNDAGVRADAAMLDFEDSMKPTWENVLQGLENLIGAANGTLQHREEKPTGIKTYQLNPDDMPLLMVRVRGLHMQEQHFKVDGKAVSAGLFDLVTSVAHTAKSLIQQGKTPKYYIPKCEHYLEARWWNYLLSFLEDELHLVRGALRCTLLIETLPATFQIEEILFEMRDHIAALNIGRWDKIFSDIKTLRNHPDRILADRGSIGLNRPWMKAYALRLIHFCHKRGAFALGGMAAFTPGSTAARRAEQNQKVVADKSFEASLGCDGCWVSHPYFIGGALSAFPQKNQISTPLPDLPDPDALLHIGGGPYTKQALIENIRVGIAYCAGWAQGLGCIAWNDLMEDLATLEISRSQTGQWIQHHVVLETGEMVTAKWVATLFEQELEHLEEEMQWDPHERQMWQKAAEQACNVFTEQPFRLFFDLD